MTIKNTSILVVSCDRYRDLWQPFFMLFFRYWPDCPFDVYLCSNEIPYDDARVQTILVGPDTSWSSNLKRCLERLPTDYLVLLQEDFLFTKVVDSEKVKRYVKYLQEQRAACLRLMPFPPPDAMTNDEPKIGTINKGVDYRVSLMAAIWDKSVLQGLLKDGESPWDFENYGSRRSDSIKKLFLCIDNKDRKDWPIDYFGTAIVQGKWVRKAVKLCKREGIKVDKQQREFESRWSPLRRKCLASLRRVKRRLLSGHC